GFEGLSWRCQAASWGALPGSWDCLGGLSQRLRCRGTYTPGSFERPSRPCAVPADRSDSGAVLTDARPDPVGGIRTGTREGALVVGPWGDWRSGRLLLSPRSSRVLPRAPGPGSVRRSPASSGTHGDLARRRGAGSRAARLTA